MTTGGAYCAGMAIVGITGSIASGKSTFRDLLAPLLKAAIADADIIAKELLANPEVRELVRRDVCPQAYRPEDGSPDREEIRRVVFSSPAAKARLEAILHPRVRQAWLDQAASARIGKRNLLVDIPLLFETSAEAAFDFVVTVACSPAVQRARLAERGMEADLAEKIISSQWPVPKKIECSTHAVWNDGSREALRAQAEEFVRQIAGESF